MAPNRAKRLLAELTRRFEEYEQARAAAAKAKAAPKAEPKAAPKAAPKAEPKAAAKAAAPGLEALQDFTEYEQEIIEFFGSLSAEEREAYLAQFDGELPEKVKFRLGLNERGMIRVLKVPRRRAIELLRRLRE